MARPDGNGQCVDFGAAHEVHGFIGIGGQLVPAQVPVVAEAVLRLTLAGFQRAEMAYLVLDRSSGKMSQLTLAVTLAVYSKSDGVVPSIMTDEASFASAERQVYGDVLWP